MEKDYKEKVGKVLGYVLEGLSEQESCLMSGISWDDFETLKKRSPSLIDLISKKRIEFKRKHLLNIGKKDDPKTSQWLLEKLRPDEFGSKKVAETPTNIFAVLIKDIQSSNDRLITEPKRIETESRTTNPTSIQEVLK